MKYTFILFTLFVVYTVQAMNVDNNCTFVPFTFGAPAILATYHQMRTEELKKEYEKDEVLLQRVPRGLKEFQEIAPEKNSNDAAQSALLS